MMCCHRQLLITRHTRLGVGSNCESGADAYGVRLKMVKVWVLVQESLLGLVKDWKRPMGASSPHNSLSKLILEPTESKLGWKAMQTWTNSADKLVWDGTGFTVTVRPVSLHQRLMGWKHRQEISLNVRFMFPKSCSMLLSKTTNPDPTSSYLSL